MDGTLHVPARPAGLGHGWRPSRGLRRAVEIALPLLTAAVAVVAIPAAHAEGPGYGGAADKLSVSWTGSAAPTPATTAAPTPAQTTAPTASATAVSPAPDTASASVSSTPQPTAATASDSATTTATTSGDVAVPAGSGGRGTGVVAAPAAVSPHGGSLHVGGVGFRGLSEVTVRVGSQPVFVARVDSTGTLSVTAPPSNTDAISAGTSVVALGRSPSGTSKTLVGSVPPRPNGTGPVDLVPWMALAVLVALSGSWLVRRVGTTASRVREG
jgi:hypothetical protein